MTDQAQSTTTQQTPTTTVWVRVCALNEIPTDKAKGITVNGQVLVITRCGNEPRILQGTCSHMWYPLANSKVEDCTLTCSLHRSRFDTKDGSVQAWVTFPPVIGAALAAIRQSKALRNYPTKVENGDVYLQWASANVESVRVRF